MPYQDRHSSSARYLQARVTKVFPDGGLEAEPRQPANTVAARIKVHHYHLPADRRPPNETYRPGDAVALFIYDDRRARADPAKAAYASAIWADPAANPWENAHTLTGLTVTGSVIGFPDDRHAIVLLDGLLADAWLNAREVPDALPYYRHADGAPLADFLSLNDRIKARVQTVDPGDCRLDISIVDALRAWEAACRQAIQDEDAPPAGYERLRLPELAEHDEQIFLWQPTAGQLANAPPAEESPPANLPEREPATASQPIWRDVRLLIVENDTAFAHSLQAWVHSQGGAVTLCAGHDDLQRLLKNGKIDHLALTHVLCDFNLSSHNESKKCHDWLAIHLGRRASPGNPHVAWMSAQPEAVRQARQAGMAGGDARLSGYLAGLPLFVKPIFFRELHAWLTEGQAPRPDDPDDRGQRALWHAEHPDAPVLERAHAALAQFCRAGKALAALWIDAPSDVLPDNDPGGDPGDVHLDLQVRASHGVASWPDDWHLALGQSLLRDVFVAREFIARRVTTAGPLRRAAPAAAGWVAAWPIASLVAPAGDGVASAAFSSALPPQGMLLAYFGDAEFTPAAGEPGKMLGELAALTCRHLDDLGALFSLSHFAREQDLFASAGRQLAAVLHELRSLSGELVPLTTETTTTPGAAAPPTSRTRQALRKLLQVAKQGLFYVRKERPERLGLAGMLQRMTADLLWLPIHRSGCSLHVLLPPKAMQVTIPLEPLEHALGNIIGNAVDWSQGRTYARVTVSVDMQPEESRMPLRIRVSDQGLGVGRDAQRNLFTPRLTEKGRKGHGMGLYISRTLLRGIGGDLLFDQRQNYRFFGATFEIRLPWCVGERAERQNADPHSPPGSRHARQSKP